MLRWEDLKTYLPETCPQSCGLHRRIPLLSAYEGEKDRVEFCHYAKALREIQSATDNEALRTSQEMLYATELLEVFEVNRY
jgi:hypothetical protein